MPVPVKPRHDGWTPERQRGFILRLALVGCVSSSAGGVGKSRESAYQLRRHRGAESFSAAWGEAQGWGRSRASDIRISRALAGEVRAVYYRGRKIDEYVRYDNRLVIAAMKMSPQAPVAWDPAELERLLDDIDPSRAARRAAKDFSGDSA